MNDKEKTKLTNKSTDELIELIKKAEPQKPYLEGDGFADGEIVYDTCICETCNTYYELDEFVNYKYCPECGQKIDLSWIGDILEERDKRKSDNEMERKK